MGEASGQVVAVGVAAALSPVPIVGIVLVLGTRRARADALSFLAGWVAGLGVVGAVVLLAAGGAGAREGGAPAGWVDVLELALGVALLVLAARRWRSRPREGETAGMPGWMRSVDRLTAGRAAALGAALAAANPKNLALTVAAGAAISQTGASAGAQALALLVYVLIGTLGVGVPVAIFLLGGERSRATLDEIKLWMARNDAAIMAVLCLLIGAKLIGDAITGFSA